MMRGLRAGVVALAVVTAAYPANAIISRVYFTGEGVVTYAYDGDFSGFTLHHNPAVIGQSVYVSGVIELATAGGGQPVPDDFTGRVTLSNTDLRSGNSSFQFSARNGGVDGNNRVVLPAAQIDFVNGAVSSFDLDADDDGAENFLVAPGFGYYPGRPADPVGHFGFDTGYGTAANGGTWQLLSAKAVALPEPASWLMMIVGFAATALRLRGAGRTRRLVI